MALGPAFFAGFRSLCAVIGDVAAGTLAAAFTGSVMLVFVTSPWGGFSAVSHFKTLSDE